VQANIRGLIVRNKVRAGNPLAQKKFMPYHDPNAPFELAAYQKIVNYIFFKKLLNIIFYFFFYNKF
jgi:hypothetical protein